MNQKPFVCLGAMFTLCGLAGCGAAADVAEGDGAESVATTEEEFNPSPAPAATKGHAMITMKALKILADRKLLPPLLADAKNQALVVYGNNFADGADVGWPNPDNGNSSLTTEMRNAMTSKTPVGGLQVTSTGANVEFDFSSDGLNPGALIQPAVWLKWMPAEKDKHTSTSLRYITDVRIWSHHWLRSLKFWDSAEWVLEKDLPDEYSVDNLYHYTLGDLKDLNDPAIGEGDTRLRMYPLTVEHTAEPDGSIKNTDLSTKLVARSVNQALLAGADFGATKYGSIVYNLSRKFFEANTVAQPDIRDLIRVGNDVPGWHTGRMEGHGEMSGMHFDFPHTYLGGMPYACLGSQNPDACSDGKPMWPSWIRNNPPTEGELQELAKQNPGRSNRAALIYLGWATHMMQDSSLPHHVANWTGKEHGKQDDLGDAPWLYTDYTGKTVQNCITGIPKLGALPKPICTTAPHPYSGTAYSQWLVDKVMGPELDALLGPVNAPKDRDTVCRSLGISDDTLLTVGGGWQSIQPLYLANARKAYGQRKEFLPGGTANTEMAREYVKNAVLGTLKLLYCAMPQASAQAQTQTRPRIFVDNSKGGSYQTLQPGLYDTLMQAPRSLLIGNDQLSSLDVPAGYAVTLYSDANERGSSLQFGQGEYGAVSNWGFNDLTSSISVTKNGQQPSFFLRLKRDSIESGYARSYGNRRYLDVRGTGTASGDQNRALQSWEYTGAWSQQFVYDPATHAIMNPTNGLCLDIPWADPSNGNAIQMYPCHGGTNQQWNITTNGQIVSALGKCLEVGGNDMNLGARVQLWDCVGSEMQAFDVVYGCSHDSCQQGPALAGSCSPDVGDVCAFDPYCCSTYWDGICVSELPKQCL